LLPGDGDIVRHHQRGAHELGDVCAHSAVGSCKDSIQWTGHDDSQPLLKTIFK
jgi:hypothetical protein